MVTLTMLLMDSGSTCGRSLSASLLIQSRTISMTSIISLLFVWSGLVKIRMISLAVSQVEKECGEWADNRLAEKKPEGKREKKLILGKKIRNLNFGGRNLKRVIVSSICKKGLFARFLKNKFNIFGGKNLDLKRVIL